MPHKYCNMVFVISILGLTACATNVEKQDDPSYAPVHPEARLKQEPREGSIFSMSAQLSLYEDMKAHQVGDIITVQLIEQVDSEKKANSTWGKTSNATLANPTFLGNPIQINGGDGLPYGSSVLSGNKNLNLSASISDSNSFSGTADAKQSNKISGTVTVTVAQILPNGNLFVKGERWINVNDGNEFIRISGIIRPKDIGPDNTVLSTRIADARIAYSGTGGFANSNKPGWLVQILASPFWPF
jgi:flagellar L-ring protein precursor FlgH